MPRSLNQPTLEWLAKQGYLAEVIERWHKHGHVTVDPFGIVDILAFKPGTGTLCVQCTSRHNHAARRQKILAESRVGVILASGAAVWVLSWKEGVADPFVESITLEQWQSAQAAAAHLDSAARA